jgi:hypothetical protein
MTKLSPTLDAALTYAAHGLRAFPLKPRSKEPATSHGFKDATIDGGILQRRFLAAGAEANVGIATGGGIIVVDTDEWIEGIPNLLDGHELPRTWAVKTGRGRHFYYRTPLDRKIRTIPGLGPKLDIKAEGGYVVAPPSVHPDGSSYEWMCHPSEMAGAVPKFPITDAPDWMLELFEKYSPRPITEAQPNSLDPVIAEGGRNDALSRSAGAMRRRGMSVGAIEAALLAENLLRCSPPLGEDEVLQIARSVGRYAPDKVAMADEKLQAKAQRIAHVSTQKRSPHVTPDIPEAISEGIIGRRASEVQSKAVRWLWKGRLPAGMLVILDGDPGLGKSTIMSDWIARVTTGSEWPDGTQAPRGGAIYVGSEDPEEQVIVPRLRAAGADLARVQLVRAIPLQGGGERTLILPRDLGLLKAAIHELDARLLVFDPIITYVAADLSSYSDKDVRQALTPLADMLADTDCCGIMLRHLKKDDKASLAMYRGGGSIAFIALSRAGFAVGKKKDGTLALMPTKANLAPKAKALKYALEAVVLEGDIETSKVIWDGETDADADEVLTAFGGDREKPREKAEELVMEILTQGPQPSKTLEDAAKGRGISLSTLKRAKEDLGVASRHVGATVWWNALPEDRDKLANVGAVRGADGRLYSAGGRGTEPERASSLIAVLSGPGDGQAEGLDTKSDLPYTKPSEIVSFHSDSPDVGSEGQPEILRTRAREDSCPTCGEEWVRRRGRRYCPICRQWEVVAA